MPKYQQGVYVPKNPEKYIGKHAPRYRSGWELTFMRMCDTHPGILGWASESHRIPYIHPMTGKATTYVPDFFIVYVDKNDRKHAELIEVKPSSQIKGNAKSASDQAAAMVNEAKWKIAQQWCKQQGIAFRVITENEIFNKPQGSKRKKAPLKPKKPGAKGKRR
jgi:hypothetical protein